jgi:hypothetical protein
MPRSAKCKTTCSAMQESTNCSSSPAPVLKMLGYRLMMSPYAIE